jgi:hypothetical protein
MVRKLLKTPDPIIIMMVHKKMNLRTRYSLLKKNNNRVNDYDIFLFTYII